MGFSTASVTYCDQSKVAPKLCLPLETLFSSPFDYAISYFEFDSSPIQLEPTSLFDPIFPVAQEHTDNWL